jgi:two-component system OmpR family sensor kinase
VISATAMIAVVCAVIGLVTTVALRSFLYRQLDDRVRATASSATGPYAPGWRDGTDPGAAHGGPLGYPGGRTGRPASSGSTAAGGDTGHSTAAARATARDFPLAFVTGPGMTPGTLGARVDAHGKVTAAGLSEAVSASTQTRLPIERLGTDARKALAGVRRDGRAHSVTLPGEGRYRVVSVTAADGESFLVGLPTSGADDTVRTLLLVEVCVTAAGIAAAGIAGTALIRIALRPLRRVAATARRVSELRLDKGEVALHDRVPHSDTDPRTEVGQVGAALNRMLDHVGDALSARHDSETRVRRFVADASHELRTPLASIRGYAELTRRGREEVGADTRYALGRIESEACRMTALVEDLLLLARLDAGRPLDLAEVDLVPLVVDVLSDARAAGPDHVWRLDLAAPPYAAPVVRGDAARLHQVLANLLANARTHTPPGSTVTARLAVDGAEAVIEVADDGPGIPPALLPHVFERFARGDASRSRAAGSTGLGLAIAWAVVGAHGGQVGVASRPGETVFRVRLPLADPGAGTAGADGPADDAEDADDDAFEAYEDVEGAEDTEDADPYDAGADGAAHADRDAYAGVPEADPDPTPGPDQLAESARQLADSAFSGAAGPVRGADSQRAPSNPTRS